MRQVIFKKAKKFKMEISPEIEKRCDELIAQYPKKKSAAMMIMHLIQENLGYFDDDAVLFAARKLEISPIEVYGILSFYPMFSDKPRGRIHIKVCRTLSCAMAGSVKLGHEISKKLSCPIGKTSGIYTIEFVECIGNCVKAPNVQVNDKLFEGVAPEDADKFLERLEALDKEGKLAPEKGLFKADEGFNSPAYKG